VQWSMHDFVNCRGSQIADRRSQIADRSWLPFHPEFIVKHPTTVAPPLLSQFFSTHPNREYSALKRLETLVELRCVEMATDCTIAVPGLSLSGMRLRDAFSYASSAAGGSLRRL
jgi:hypothetical protein